MLMAALGSHLPAAQIERLARRCTGASAAAVDAMLRAARSQARAAGRDLSVDDLVAHAPGEAPDPAVDWRVAVHESGHALAATALSVGRFTRVVITGAGGLIEKIVLRPDADAANGHVVELFGELGSILSLCGNGMGANANARSGATGVWQKTLVAGAGSQHCFTLSTALNIRKVDRIA